MDRHEVWPPGGVVGRAGALLRASRRGTVVELGFAAFIWMAALVVAVDPETQPDPRAVPFAVAASGLSAVLTMLVWTLKDPSRRTVWSPERLLDELARLLLLAGLTFAFVLSASDLSWVTWLPLVLMPMAGGSVAARICLTVVAALGGAEAGVEEPGDDRPWREVRAERGWR